MSVNVPSDAPTFPSKPPALPSLFIQAFGSRGLLPVTRFAGDLRYDNFNWCSVSTPSSAPSSTEDDEAAADEENYALQAPRAGKTAKA